MRRFLLIVLSIALSSAVPALAAIIPIDRNSIDVFFMREEVAPRVWFSSTPPTADGTFPPGDSIGKTEEFSITPDMSSPAWNTNLIYMYYEFHDTNIYSLKITNVTAMVGEQYGKSIPWENIDTSTNLRNAATAMPLELYRDPEEYRDFYKLRRGYKTFQIEVKQADTYALISDKYVMSMTVALEVI